MCAHFHLQGFYFEKPVSLYLDQTRQVSVRVFMSLILGSMCSIYILDKIPYYIAVVFFFITFKLAHVQIFK